MEEILHIIRYVSFSIGLIGILVIIVGSVRGFYHYLLHLRQDNFAQIRYEVGSHIILGLDFLVGKDIIDTMLIDAHNPDKFWMDLAALVTVVTIRIILTYFIQKEIRELKSQKLLNGKN